MIAAAPGREVADGPTRVDLVGAGLVLVLVVVGSTQIEPNAGSRSVDALAVVCGAAGAVALAVWRRWIFVTVGIVLVAITIYLGRDYPGGPALLPGPLSLVALGYSAPRKVGLAGVVAFIMVTSTGHIVGGVELGLFQLVIVGWASAAVLAGQALAARSERAAAAREREEHRHEQALAAERLRIAQDLHDSVAHAISTINVQAGVAAHLADRRPDQVHDSLKAIRVASRDALDELGSILHLLRDTDRGAAPRAPAVRLDGVGDLVARVRDGGLAVIARVDGDLDAVPVAVSTAAYRVVQEGLTNVRRHAGLAAAAEVVVRVRGTLRASLLHHPGRWSLIGGKLAARMGMAGVLMLAGLVAGAVTAAVVAPGNDIATIGWFGLDGMVEAGGDYIRLMAWAGGYALIGTTLAVLVRSTPIALAAGLLWFGPIENVFGEGRAWADRWFPGQLLRAVIAPEPGGVTTATASLTLLAYGAVLVAVLAIVLARRDVTS